MDSVKKVLFDDKSYIKEKAVGQQFLYNGVLYTTKVKTLCCKGCAFEAKCGYVEGMAENPRGWRFRCDPEYRTDGKRVYYEMVDIYRIIRKK